MRGPGKSRKPHPTTATLVICFNLLRRRLAVCPPDAREHATEERRPWEKGADESVERASARVVWSAEAKGSRRTIQDGRLPNRADAHDDVETTVDPGHAGVFAGSRVRLSEQGPVGGRNLPSSHQTGGSGNLYITACMVSGGGWWNSTKNTRRPSWQNGLWPQFSAIAWLNRGGS
jgi:hypothetical protein